MNIAYMQYKRIYLEFSFYNLGKCERNDRNVGDRIQSKHAPNVQTIELWVQKSTGHQQRNIPPKCLDNILSQFFVRKGNKFSLILPFSFPKILK